MDFNSQASQVVEAVGTLYFSKESAKKKEANKWLENFQSTVNAWKIVDMILCDAQSAPELQFFAAQTMRKKVLTDIGQLPSGSIESLRSSIMTHIYNHRKSSKALLTQLILAVADLAVQMLDWDDPITDLENAFGSSDETVPLLLEFLKALPEECLNLRIPLDLKIMEERTKKLVDQKVCHVMDSIINFFGSHGLNAPLAPLLVSCLQSWIKNCRFEDSSHLKNRLVLISLLFQATQVPELFDEATEAICDLFRATSDASEYKEVIAEIYQGLKVLHSMAAKLIADEADEDIRSICRIFVEAGEAYMSLIIHDFPEFSVIVQGILLCSNYKNLEIVQLTFHFWWALSEKLPEVEAIHPAFATIFLELVKVTIIHLKYPNEEVEMTAQEKEDFRSFRHEIGDLLKYCCRVVGDSPPLSIVLSQLQELQVYLSQGSNVKWQDIESLLFALRAMGSNVSPLESNLLPKIMVFLPTLPQHPKIKYATILVYSRYAEWTSNHLEFLEPQIKFIVEGFEHGDSRAAAALSLKFTCQYCAPHLSAHMQSVYELFIRSLNEFHVLDTLEMVEASCYLLNSLKDTDIFNRWSAAYLECIQSQFEKIPASSSEEEIIRHLNVNFERLAVFIKHIAPNCAISDLDHPVIKFLLVRWDSLFVQSCIKFGFDERLSETICRSLINCIRKCEGYTLILPQSLLLFDACFKQHFLSAYLYATQQCVKRFSSYVNHAESLVSVMVSMSSQMNLRCSEEEAMNNYPDVVIDFFYLCSTFVSCFTNALAYPQFYQGIFPLAIEAINTKYYKETLSVLNFWNFVFELHAEWDASLIAYLQPRLAGIVTNVLSGCLRRFESETMDYACKIILLAANFASEETLFTLQQYIAGLPEDRFSVSEKSHHGGRILDSLRGGTFKIFRRDLSTFAALSRRRLNSQ